MSDKMVAWQARALGEPREVLAEVELEVPTPGPDEVLIEVAATALNLPDLLLCRGTYHERVKPPFTPGCEVVGVVREAGSEVSPTVVGERVIAMPRLPHGGLAGFCLAPARDLFPAPAEMPDEEAAALSVAYQTAWLALHHRTAIAAGDTVLVHGAAGGVGSAAVQLARAAGARVLASARGEAKREIALRLGAEHVLDPGSDFVAAVMDLTAGRGVDVVIDPVGGEVFERSCRCVAWEGHLVTIGFAAGAIPTVAANHVLLKNYSVTGLHAGAYREHDPATMRRAHENLLRLYREGAIAPLIFPLAPGTSAAEALGLLADGVTYGKVVVR